MICSLGSQVIRCFMGSTLMLHWSRGDLSDGAKYRLTSSLGQSARRFKIAGASRLGPLRAFKSNAECPSEPKKSLKRVVEACKKGRRGMFLADIDPVTGGALAGRTAGLSSP